MTGTVPVHFLSLFILLDYKKVEWAGKWSEGNMMATTIFRVMPSGTFENAPLRDCVEFDSTC